MRKIIFLMHVSLDGYVAGPNGEMDWIQYNEELEAYSHNLHERTDAAIYGRVTYGMMDGYWSQALHNPASGEGELNHARWYDTATKIVISRTMDSEPAKKRIVIGDNFVEEINKIKAQPGKDLWLLGSPSVFQTFLPLRLIDEYRLNVNPVVLGRGKPLFPSGDSLQQLTLLENKTLKGGVAALIYGNA
jgi:dihydrofolate reductase